MAGSYPDTADSKSLFKESAFQTRYLCNVSVGGSYTLTKYDPFLEMFSANAYNLTDATLEMEKVAAAMREIMENNDDS